MKSANNSTNRYLEFGMASLLPGMQYTVERMQRMLDEFRAELAALQNGAESARDGKRPWAGKSDEERSEIAKRRWETRRRNAVLKNGGGHPRDPQHPGHDAWVKKIRSANRKHWSSLSKAERNARVDGMIAAQGKTRKAA